MKLYNFMALAGALVFVWFGSNMARAQDSPMQPFSRDTAWNDTYSKGMALYKENCADCHGANGEGGTGEDAIGLPLNLQSFLTIASKNFIVRSVRNGRPSRGMPDFADSLSASEINAVAAYVKAWQYEPSKAVASGTVIGDPYEGEKWYAGICASCHGKNGEGGPQETGGGKLLVSFAAFSAPALADTGFKKSATDGFLKATLMYGRMGTPMGSYLKGQQGQVELTEEEINDIVAYLRTMPGIE